MTVAKMEQDLSAVADAAIQENRPLAKSGQLLQAIENLLVAEKQCRVAEDSQSTSRISVEIVKLCYEDQKLDLVNEKLVLLSKRRGQLRPVIREIVKEASTYLDKITNMKTKLSLLETLLSITEGKIFVENEKARLTKTLSKIKEDEGDIASAAKILQDLQVETYGTMDKKEKLEFFIDQMRLCMNNKDFIRAQLIANKVNRKTLLEEGFGDLKIQYFEQLIRYYIYKSDYLEITRSYLQIYDTPSVQSNPHQLHNTLKLICIYIILSPIGNEQSDLINRVYDYKPLSDIQLYKDILDCFKVNTLIKWSGFVENYKTELNQHQLFISEKNSWEDLRKRVIEHNIRAISTYYQKVSTKRLSELLDLSADESERSLSDLVTNKTIWARIDRPAGIVNFVQTNDAHKSLNSWSSNITALLDLVEKTNHQISREFMIHKVNI